MKRSREIDVLNVHIDRLLKRKAEKLSSHFNHSFCEDKSCSICLEEILDDVIQVELPCRHAFCSPCLHSYHISTQIEFSCPLCRAQLSENLYQYIYNNAVRLIRRADDAKSKVVARDHFVLVAREEYQRLCQLFETASESIHPSAHWLARQLQVQLLCSERRYEECIEVGEALLNSENGGFNLGVRPIVDTIRCISVCLEGLGKHKEALVSLRRIQDILIASNDQDGVVDLKRQLYMDMCRVLFKNRQFTMAIHTGTQAIVINRHFEGVYEYVALSYKAKGKWDDAITTMKKAVRYETPWDKENVKKVQEIYRKLLEEYSSISS